MIILYIFTIFFEYMFLSSCLLMRLSYLQSTEQILISEYNSNLRTNIILRMIFSLNYIFSFFIFRTLQVMKKIRLYFITFEMFIIISSNLTIYCDFIDTIRWKYNCYYCIFIFISNLFILYEWYDLILSNLLHCVVTSCDDVQIRFFYHVTLDCL